MKIAIVRLSALGDLLFSMIVLQWIKSRMPQASISWIVEEDFADILRNNPDIDHILTTNIRGLKKNLSLCALKKEIKTIREYGPFDLVIDLQGLLKSALVARLLGKMRLGYDSLSAREAIASLFYTKTATSSYSNNIVFRYKDIIDSHFTPPISLDEIYSKSPFLFSSQEAQQRVKSLLSGDKKNCLLIVGASRPYKIYPKERWMKVIQELKARVMLCWGSEEEREAALWIASQTQAVMLPKLSLDELKALCVRCDLIMGGDTGITHFGWALNRPSIALFGATPHHRNTLQTDINRTISSQSHVDAAKLDKNDYSIREIEPSEVISVAQELLWRS